MITPLHTLSPTGAGRVLQEGFLIFSNTVGEFIKYEFSLKLTRPLIVQRLVVLNYSSAIKCRTIPILSWIKFGLYFDPNTIRFFAIQDWKEEGDLKMVHIPSTLNPSDDLTKPLGWVLHSRHCGIEESLSLDGVRFQDTNSRDPREESSREPIPRETRWDFVSRETDCPCLRAVPVRTGIRNNDDSLSGT